MKHWRIDQVAWDSFDPSRLDPEIIPLVKAAAMVERNGDDYALYLQSVFHDDPDFHQAAGHWAEEEVQHGDALGKWAMLADPGWDFEQAFARYRAGYKIDVKADASIRGSRTGELIARCMVETGTSSYYTALGEATEEPVLKEVCRLIAADEYRHFKLFYDHMRRYLARENLSFPRRLKVAAGRIGESEDDELAFAFHCGNEDTDTPYDHDRCIAGYMGRAMNYYRYRHIERGMGMVFKSIGLQPRGRLSALAAKGAWRLLTWRRDRYAAALRKPAPLAAAA
ncbi:ferritin-like domain-containing protein [Falsiroseomonas sp.]|uniref:ferritin-like domain-containing protein n=1 Tax=Falsiroseomonas sp. TaxID=2870721 RepID=UPI003F6E7D3D